MKLWGKYLAGRREMLRSLDGLVVGLHKEFEHERVVKEATEKVSPTIMIASARHVIGLVRRAMLVWGMRSWVSVWRETQRLMAALRMGNPSNGNPFHSYGIHSMDDLATTAGWGEHDFTHALDNMRSSRFGGGGSRVNLPDVGRASRLEKAFVGQPVPTPRSHMAHIQVGSLLQELAPFLDVESARAGSSPLRRNDWAGESPGFMRGYQRGKAKRRGTQQANNLLSFDELDTNCDGVLDRAEFEAATQDRS